MGVVMDADIDTDTKTLATDKQVVEIEAKARTRKVLHWPELIYLINRLRAVEAERDYWMNRGE
jgi:hypothetical protein